MMRETGCVVQHNSNDERVGIGMEITKEKAMNLMVRAMEPEHIEHLHKPESDGYWKARNKISKARKRAQKCFDAMAPYLTITEAENET